MTGKARKLHDQFNLGDISTDLCERWGDSPWSSDEATVRQIVQELTEYLLNTLSLTLYKAQYSLSSSPGSNKTESDMHRYARSVLDVVRAFRSSLYLMVDKLDQKTDVEWSSVCDLFDTEYSKHLRRIERLSLPSDDQSSSYVVEQRVQDMHTILDEVVSKVLRVRERVAQLCETFAANERADLHECSSGESS